MAACKPGAIGAHARVCPQSPHAGMLLGLREPSLAKAEAPAAEDWQQREGGQGSRRRKRGLFEASTRL